MLKMFFVGFAYSAKFIGTEQLERQSGRGDGQDLKSVAHDINLTWCVGRRARWTNAQWDVHAKVKLATGHLYVRAPRKAQVDVVSTRIDLKTVHVS